MAGEAPGVVRPASFHYRVLEKIEPDMPQIWQWARHIEL